jgi:Catalytic LigB subunit of aromatic ring-opening dioxygenase
MGEILGLGLTHYPALAATDRHMTGILRGTLASPRVPAYLKEVSNWPAPMQAEWGADEGLTAAAEHRARLVAAFRRARQAIDDFGPDFLLIWGDDQYENFREDVIPPFCIYILAEAFARPLGGSGVTPLPDNAWGEPPDTVFRFRGHADAGRYLARGLLESSFDMPYAYALRHERGLAHSFAFTLMYLDYDRRGFDVPVVPFHVNCYGSAVVRNRGGSAHLRGDGTAQPDPPGPTPRRCFELGRATARLLRDSPWRVALIGSSSWSHAFLTEKHCWLYPDVEADRQRAEDLRTGAFAEWGSLDLAQLEAAGQHELLNWVCLAGAMTELGRAAEIIDYVETYILNSTKCIAVFR